MKCLNLVNEYAKLNLDMIRISVYVTQKDVTDKL